MRLFIAMPFPESQKAGLNACNQALRLGCDRGRFTHADNFHLTLLHTKWRTLASTPGKGAKAMITVPIPCEVKTR